MRRFGLFLAATAAVVLFSCAEDEIGACDGFMNGSYFRIRFVNYFAEGSADIRLNGRFIGKVDAAEMSDSGNQLRPSYVTLGEFPVCDAWELDAKGNGFGTNRLCSDGEDTSPACSTPDFCWFDYVLAPDPDDPHYGFPLEVMFVDTRAAATPQCPCEWNECF